MVADGRRSFLMSSLLLIEILQNHFFRFHIFNIHTTLKFHRNSQVDLNMNKASNFAEVRRNRKIRTNPYDRILEAARIQVSSNTDVNVLLSWNNYLRSGLPTLLVISTRPVGSGIVKNKQHSSNRQKKYPLFCLETPLLQLFSDTPTSGINSSMKILYYVL